MPAEKQGRTIMKLYNENYPAPNPRKVRIFLAEKGLHVDLVHVPMKDRAHKSPEFLSKNSLGQLPVLETDDGAFISESIAICRYLEELHPDKPLFGRTALDKALIEMWIKRTEFRLWTPMSQAWRNDDPRTEHVVKVRFKDFGAYSRTQVVEAMTWIDGELGDGRAFLAGDAFSMADIVLLCGLDFAKFVNMPIPEGAANLQRWHAAVSARPAARA
jgi:glutathione S-transferase